MSGFFEWWEKHGRFGLIGMGLGLILLGGIWMIYKPMDKGSDIQFYSVQEEEVPEELFVDISGGINKPGVYELAPESRLKDLVLAAGDFSDDADEDWISRNLNLARRLNDGEKIYIPRENEISNVQNSNVENDQVEQVENVKSSAFVNINTATLGELETLPGIGPAFGERIIDYRNANGGFKSIEEIQAVSGIGEKTFEKIKGQISI